MEQENKKLIDRLDNLLEAKLGNFLPRSTSTFDSIEKILEENKRLFDDKIKSLATSGDIHKIIDEKIKTIDKSLANYFSDIDIYTLEDYKKFIKRVFTLCPVDNYLGYFIKESVARKILSDIEPKGIMEFFSYNSLDELFDNINPLEVLTISRYSENPYWQELYKKKNIRN